MTSTVTVRLKRTCWTESPRSSRWTSFSAFTAMEKHQYRSSSTRNRGEFHISTFVIVHDGRHGAEQRQHVRDEEVEVRALVERVGDDALSDFQDVGDAKQEGEDPAQVVARELHPRLGVDAADVRLVPGDEDRHRHQHEEDVRLQRQAVQETLVGENAMARHTRTVTELLTELHRESHTE